ncbi:MAG TPA: cytotoxic translational repressor of toxin-antitoxin stability system [Candidatus Ratteibacteria bacterium]|nr:cytotoxic translational repressor of toxin-antitoxin stability system [Candidatus Ratteibacteria bacterium]
MWKIEISKPADKFIRKERIKDEKILLLIKKLINYSKGIDENIDVKRMRGKWDGYYRIRVGKMRIILKVDFKAKNIFIDRINYRGGIYK